MNPWMRHGRILFLLLLAICVFFSSCVGTPPDYFAYREKGFTAELRGTRGSTPFSGWVRAVPDATGYAVTLCYSTPAALADVTVRARLDGSGRPCGNADISCGSVVHSLPAVSLEGLLSPLLCLLSVTEIATVTRVSEGYSLTLPADACLVLSTNGTPLSFSDRTLSFAVAWWETNPVDEIP